ncbi:MAG: hypothetical protein JW846_09965 [Dehalococcoidia bacterium]|nr:hypothetical protein [Dehalococcoidia bacterium]
MSQNGRERQHAGRPDRAELLQAVRKAAMQFKSLLPILCGVVLLIGLLRAALPPSVLGSVFRGHPLADALTGAAIGSILAGNPVNSYVISEQLLADGVSLFAIAAFIVSWVTVGIAQLPAEAMTLGNRFAVLRNSLSFILAIIIGLLTAVVVSAFGGIA